MFEPMTGNVVLSGVDFFVGRTKQEERLYTYNITLRLVRAAIVTVEKQ